jgi:uncharacterized membrane protein
MSYRISFNGCRAIAPSIDIDASPHNLMVLGSIGDTACPLSLECRARMPKMTQETDLMRIARIGDSVFAVTLTLLAYRVRIPDQAALSSGALEPLMPFLRDLGAFVLSFFVASMFYISHWRVFRRMRRSDLRFVALNLAFLGTLVLLPISTSLLSADTSFGRLAYSGNLFFASSAGMFLRAHARRIDREAFGPGRLLIAPVLSMAIFGSAALIGFYYPDAAIGLWWCALASPWIDRRWGIGRTD